MGAGEAQGERREQDRVGRYTGQSAELGEGVSDSGQGGECGVRLGEERGCVGESQRRNRRVRRRSKGEWRKGEWRMYGSGIRGCIVRTD